MGLRARARGIAERFELLARAGDAYERLSQEKGDDKRALYWATYAEDHRYHARVIREELLGDWPWRNRILWPPDMAWKWRKWTIGFWTDPDNRTAFGLDIGPLEVCWRYPGYRP